MKREEDCVPNENTVSELIATIVAFHTQKFTRNSDALVNREIQIIIQRLKGHKS